MENIFKIEDTAFGRRRRVSVSCNTAYRGVGGFLLTAAGVGGEPCAMRVAHRRRPRLLCHSACTGFVATPWSLCNTSNQCLRSAGRLIWASTLPTAEDTRVRKTVSELRQQRGACSRTDWRRLRDTLTTVSSSATFSAGITASAGRVP